MISRRNALRLFAGGAAMAGAYGAAPIAGLRFHKAHAMTPDKTLIKIFMRGGTDGMNFFIPYGDADYYALRPGLQLPAPNGADPDAVIDMNGFYGLHPALSPLMEIWDGGDLAIAPAAHFTEGQRSHFDNQKWVELGFVAPAGTGYLNRYLSNTDLTSPFRAIAAGSTGVFQSLQGSFPVPAIRDIGSFALKAPQWCSGEPYCSENSLYPILQSAYGAEGKAELPIQDITYQNGDVMSGMLQFVQDLDGDYVADAGGLDYSNSSLGRGLRLAAQLIKAEAGLEVAAVNWTNGWDTHSNQRPAGVAPSSLAFNHHAGMRQGAEDLLTFYRDLSAMRDKVMVIVGTEFGRTARENGSRGTDHGYAAAWFAMGGNANGGFHGAWPGLAEQQLHRGRFLEMSVNYKDIIAEALVRHLGMDQNTIGAVFPNHTFTDNAMFAASVS